MESTKTADFQQKKGASGFKKFLRWLLFICILIFCVFFWWKYYFTYSDGNRTGLLQKLSRKGTIFKTYEGEMVLSSIASTNNVALASEKFYFSVEADSIAKKLQDYEGKNVKVHYLQKNGTLPWRGDTEYIVDAVEQEIK